MAGRDPSLIPSAFRPLALVIVAAAAALVAVLGHRYAGGAAPGRVDVAIDTRLAYRLRDHQHLLQRLVFLGSPTCVAATSLLLGVTLAIYRPWRAVLLALLAPGLAAVLSETVLKPLIGRTLNSGLAFPSGHTTGAFSLAVVAVLVLIVPGRVHLPWPVRALVGLGGLALAAGTATALVALRAHYATDTIGGVGVAVGTVVLVALVIDLLADAGQLRGAERFDNVA